MNLKEKLSHKWRQMALIASVALLSSSALQAQNLTEQKRKDTSKAYFSPKELASALSVINSDDKQTEAFLEAYLQKVDSQGKISPNDLFQVFKESGIQKTDAVKFSKFLLSLQQQHSGHGYNFGAYQLNFAIDDNGHITKLHFNGENKISSRDIDEVHLARCRHRELATDDPKERFQASQFLTKMLVRDVILERQKGDKKVQNGEKFLQNFEQELRQNGLQIGQDGKLHGVKESADKPLLTTKDLYGRYVLKQRQEMKKFYE